MNAPSPLTSTATVTIEKLVHGGEGLGRQSDGKVVFARDVAAGDKISGQVQKKSGRLMIQHPEIVQASTERVAPGCQHANFCGGCDWQHIEEGSQQHWKHAIVEESLSRLGKFENPDVQSILYDTQWAYRHTVSWQVSQINGAYKLSYYARNSRDNVFFNECPILAEPLQKTAQWLNEQQALLEQVTRIKARCNTAGKVLLGVAWKDQKLALSSDLITEMFSKSPVTGLFSMGGFATTETENDETNGEGVEDEGFSHLWGEETLTDSISGKEFTYGLSHFMQVNPAMANTMADFIKSEVSRLSEASSILELYCGIGILGLTALQDNQNLIGVEGHDVAIEFADLNATKLGINDRTHFDAIGVEAYTEVSEQSFDIAICDPPRNGMKPEVIAWLSEYITDTVIYVSCNPATLARDCRQFAESGFRLQTVQPLDLFPQTSHIEAIAILKKLAE